MNPVNNDTTQPSYLDKLPEEELVYLFNFIPNGPFYKLLQTNIQSVRDLHQPITTTQDFDNLALIGERFLNEKLRRGYLEQKKNPVSCLKLSPADIYNISKDVHTHEDQSKKLLPLMDQDKDSRIQKNDKTEKAIKEEHEGKVTKFLKEEHGDSFMRLHKWVRLLNESGFNDEQANLAIAFTYLISADDKKLQRHLPRLRLMITEMLMRFRYQYKGDYNEALITGRAKEILWMLYGNSELNKLLSLGVVSIFSNEQTIEMLDKFREEREMIVKGKKSDDSVVVVPILFRVSAICKLFSYNSPAILRDDSVQFNNKTWASRIQVIENGRYRPEYGLHPLQFLKNVFGKKCHNEPISDEDQRKIKVEIPIINFPELPIHPNDDGNIRKIYQGTVPLDNLSEMMGKHLAEIREESRVSYSNVSYLDLTKQKTKELLEKRESKD